MLLCPQCRNTFEDDVRSCPHDGRRLVTREVLDAAGNDALLGTTLAERYTLTGRIGAGGMGTVYRAEQSPLGREVALKVLRRELGRDPDTVARFTREARLLSQLRHPNTVAIFDFGQSADGLLYLAMELLEGEMLSSRMRRMGALDVAEAARIAAGVLRSLDEAHSRGIIHRDLKPDNIFLAKVHGRPEDDEIVKVVDFGIAKIRDGEHAPGLDPVATQEGTVFGTPRYMSPEQAQGRSLDGRSDLYAVGVLLFHMLTGSAPFTDDDAVIVMAHHIKTVPPLVCSVAPEQAIPESLEALVAQALSKSPDDRPQSAEDFLTALEALTDDIMAARAHVMLLTEETVILPVQPPPRRTWLGLAAVLSLLVVLGGLSLFKWHPSPESASGRTRAAIARPAAAPARAPDPVSEPVVAPPAVVAPEALASALTASPPATVDPPDGAVANARRERHHRSHRSDRPTATIDTTPPSLPTATPHHPRRNAQPYGTFEGM